MKLYLLAYDNEDGESLDLFVTADSPTAAVLMWRAEWSDMLEPGDFSGPLRTGNLTRTNVLRVFSINPTGLAGVLSWHSNGQGHHGSVDLVGWVYQ